MTHLSDSDPSAGCEEVVNIASTLSARQLGLKMKHEAIIDAATDL